MRRAPDGGHWGQIQKGSPPGVGAALPDGRRPLERGGASRFARTPDANSRPGRWPSILFLSSLHEPTCAMAQSVSVAAGLPVKVQAK
jgi:hypothetical protein